MDDEPIEISDSLPVVIDAAPKLVDIPEKAQQIFALLACGFSASSIAKLAKCTPGAIRHMIDKYDPKHEFALSPQEKRAFLAKLWEARAGEALLHMTPDKLEEASAVELATIAAKATKVLPSLQQREQPAQNPYILLEKLAG